MCVSSDTSVFFFLPFFPQIFILFFVFVSSLLLTCVPLFMKCPRNFKEWHKWHYLCVCAWMGFLWKKEEVTHLSPPSPSPSSTSTPISHFSFPPSPPPFFVRKENKRKAKNKKQNKQIKNTFSGAPRETSALQYFKKENKSDRRALHRWQLYYSNNSSKKQKQKQKKVKRILGCLH